MPSTVYTGHKVQSSSNVRVATKSTISVECVHCLDEPAETAWYSIWKTMCEQDPLQNSGHFHPEFAKAVCRVRDDVEFAIIRDQGEITGIFAFQRIGRKVAHPVGGMMSDFHGLIAKRDAKIDFGVLLRETGLSQFDFHALQKSEASQSPLAIKKVYRVLNCPYIDLTSGQPAYQDWLLHHSSTLKRLPQKARAMVRRLGPMRLEFDCRDPHALEQLIAMKRAKYRRTRTFDLLGVKWTSNLLREIFQVRKKGFRGQLSVLWAGDTLVAAHFGFVNETTLHYWFPAHQDEHGRFSPGTQLMYELTQNATDNGVQRIDLGYGASELKDRFANGRTTVEYGCYGFNPLSRSYGQGRFEIRQALKRIPAKETVKKLVRPILPNLGKGKFR